MKVRVLIIGMGTGNLDQLTREAIVAMNQVDLFLVADKGEASRDLIRLRNEICQTFIRSDRYRMIEVPDPERDRAPSDYPAAVSDWHAARAQAYAALIMNQLPENGTVGFLVWGDPAFYDSTIRIAKSLGKHGLDINVRVIPGISSLQLLAARHGITLNQIGGSIHVTTGRRLVEEYRPELSDVAVMLDGKLACAGLVERYPDLYIFWGAQLGLPAEVLIEGRLSDVLDRIRTVRADIRARDGWVMDIYLLRHPT
jgi:precorrin-6A synthase